MRPQTGADLADKAASFLSQTLPTSVLPSNSTLDAMRSNPQSDWTIPDIKKVCRQIGLEFTKPTRGSHFKVSSRRLEGILPVPARRPIKPVYIRSFVSLADAHLAAGREVKP